MHNRYRIRTVIGYCAESLRYAEDMEDARWIVEQQRERYPGCPVRIEDIEAERRKNSQR